MNNKKIWIMIFIAGILALITALCLYNAFKADEIEEIQEVQEEVTETVPAEDEVKEVKAENSQSESAKTIMPQKTTVKLHKTTQSHKQSNVSTTGSEKTQVKNDEEVKVQGEVSVTEPDKAVVVPVKYSTTNTYKYVYTPRRFSKK